MSIFFDEEKKLFHLRGKGTSYVMQLVHDGYLCHVYWGPEIDHCRLSSPIAFWERSFSPTPDPNDHTFSTDSIPMEYPTFGNGDFRTPAFQLQTEDGATITDLRYVSHKITEGKPMPKGLPATYVEKSDEAQTLIIEMQDHITNLHVFLYYTVFRDFAAITRRVHIENRGNSKLKILRAMSANVDFRDDEFDMLTFYGSHANERNLARRPIVPGTQSVESSRGASSHQQNPFFVLLRHGANENSGEVYGMNLVYSGNFLAQVQVDQFRTARASIGINPLDFSWLLEPNETFDSPEAVMVFSAEGLEGMSHTLHGLYRTRLCRGKYRDLERPVLINNWEATHFEFDADKIEAIAKEAHELGVELMVLDDGWFGHRDDDTTSLGDWKTDLRKLPNGLADLANRITATGMKFGLWFEPEMISPDSDLYREHPDWCIHVEGRPRTQSRNQLILDLSRPEICDYIIKTITAILESAPISYVKWDMNRNMTEAGSASLPPERQRETAHRYILGLYHMMDEITSKFPDILFESCAGGGARVDPGMFYYMPQAWTSVNTDAVCRLKSQYGTSIIYPASTMCAHVSAVPNFHVGRITPFETHGMSAMSANFGYELDPLQLTEEEKTLVKQQISFYKKLSPLIHSGTLYRLLSPFEGNESAFMFVSQDQKQAAVYYFRILSQPTPPVRILRLRGLDKKKLYTDEETETVFGGDELMNAGITLPQFEGDFQGHIWIFKEK
jgi:alpha-galactosidase